MREYVLKFDDSQTNILSVYGYCSELLTISDDEVYYNGYYICKVCEGSYVTYLCLVNFLQGFHIGFDFGEDTCLEYTKDNYILIDKNVPVPDLSDLDDLYIPEELKQ